MITPNTRIIRISIIKVLIIRYLTPAFAAGLERSGKPVDNMRLLRVDLANYSDKQRFYS